MGAILLSIPYILVIIYLMRRSLAWMEACHGFCHRLVFKIPEITLTIFFAASPLLGFLLPNSPVQHFLQRVSDFWLGVLAYTFLVTLITFIIKIILRFVNKTYYEKMKSPRVFAVIGGVMALIIATVSICGYIHAGNIKTQEYDVYINKPGTDMTLVLASDFHMGYNTGTKEVEKYVEIINSMDPDIVCFPGDIFNNDYDALEDPKGMIKAFKSIDSTYGVYASYGNHDVDEPLFCGFTFDRDKKPVSDPRMDQFLEDSNITLLMDETVLINDSFYLTGRRDDEKPGRGVTTRESATEVLSDLDKSLPIIVMDHSPKELNQLSNAGCDLDLSGHTHNGQLFPVNLIAKIIWENPTGKLKVNNMTSIVTSGVGVFGPDMRVGTDSEIVKINIHFNN